MSNPSPWSKYCNNLFANEELGFFLDLSNSGVSETDIQTMKPAFAQVFTAMNKLENGAISNPDEDRQVGHYWLRNPELAPTPLIKTQITQALTAITKFAANIINGNLAGPAGKTFTNILLIGIGGSALGPQFIADALGPNNSLTIHFLDNTDPDGIDRTLNRLTNSLSQTLVIVISKSGGTAETRNGMLETRHYFQSHHLNFAKQAVAITGEGSQLYTLADQEHWLAIFPMWDWVGGRTSVTSAVGLLPAALLGIDIQAFLRGAKIMDEVTRQPEIHKNPAALLALTWFIVGDGAGAKDMVILPYKDRLLLFSRYLQQLIMESVGKSLDLDGKLVQQGIAVYGNKGSTDQHAYVQQLRDGLDNFFVTFIEVLNDRDGGSILVDGQNHTGDYLFGFHRGTESALQQNKRRSLTITISELSPASVGSLVALYERAVGFYATLININAYDQPGVEAGKKAAGFVLKTKNEILQLLAEVDHNLSITEIGARLNLKDEEALIYSILRHHAANNPLTVEGSFYQPALLKVGLANKVIS